MTNRVFQCTFNGMSHDRESLDVTENLRRQVDALSAENQRLRARWRSVSMSDLFSAAALFGWGYLTHVILTR